MNILFGYAHSPLGGRYVPGRLSKEARALIESSENTLYFSAASVWEIAIKRGLGRMDSMPIHGSCAEGLLDNGYRELRVDGTHAVALDQLPLIHKDPFDRSSHRAVSRRKDLRSSRPMKSSAATRVLSGLFSLHSSRLRNSHAAEER